MDEIEFANTAAVKLFVPTFSKQVTGSELCGLTLFDFVELSHATDWQGYYTSYFTSINLPGDIVSLLPNAEGMDVESLIGEDGNWKENAQVPVVMTQFELEDLRDLPESLLDHPRLEKCRVQYPGGVWRSPVKEEKSNEGGQQVEEEEGEKEIWKGGSLRLVAFRDLRE